MVLAKVNRIKQENIVSSNKFVANNIYVVAVKEIDKQSFLILFMCRQDFDESYIYLQIAVIMENEFEYEYFHNHSLNLYNLKDNPDKKEEYDKLIGKMNDDNIYSCDINMHEDDTHPRYYTCRAIRQIDSTHASMLQVYFPLHNFVRLNAYFNKIIKSEKQNIEYIFLDPYLNGIELYNIEQIKLDASCVESDDLCSIYHTHYTMNCGPKEFKFNYVFKSNDYGLELKIPMNKEMYECTYSRDPIISDIFIFGSNIYLLHFFTGAPEGLIDLNDMKYSLLAIPIDVAEKKTNLIDPSDIFIKGEY